MTNTELSDIAKAATTGLSGMPNTGLRGHLHGFQRHVADRATAGPTWRTCGCIGQV